MADIVGFDSPLTKLKREYEEKLAQRDRVIEELQRVAADAREKAARLRGTNDMLRLLITDLEKQMAQLADQVTLIRRNLLELKGKLPDIPED